MSKELHKVPNGSRIRVVGDAKAPPAHREFVTGEVLTFSHIDGMYSLCFDELDRPVHLAAWTEVEIIED